MLRQATFCGTLERMDQYHHGNLKAALLKAAFQVIGKIGVDGFTLREVARKAGVSHNAPYRHFKSKEDLVAALAAESLRQLTDAVRAAVDQEPSPQGRLRASARAYLHWALKNPSRFQLTFHGVFDREQYPEYVEAYHSSLALLSGLVEVHKPETLDADLASELVWSSVHGIAELGLAKRLRDGDQEQLERLADVAVETLAAGMKAKRK
jgi:AcrR family transcriptional regulator